MESKLTNEQVLTALREQFGDAVGQEEQTTDHYLNVYVTAESVHAMIEWLYAHGEFKVQFLTNITGIHFPDNDEDQKMVIVYHLHSLQNNFRLRLKAYLPIENPSIHTITDIFSAANWLERETYDFFGINFVNHPNLTRILNEDSMDYFPMRKEYHLEDETRQDKDNRFFGR
ncbi:NADH-quinone oxidoreductase subunit C [Crocinitomicaceae bacterium CZZ-1]|uniref:NADH-quinone oxidoreductase subunit C n=1 Tax=Taishania pollutisoli TaxID=2766479 RepID=A0A8J6TS17_9FLAO|nr:NADH-quinone oxidoreductase subunit C [Taishania pollutisoli]MBC9811677.1 NADH-quinone oxidoreductase subunit C [Taishania pollutisoli]NGF75486.1 NADH-quinone oxidoreductase subunit C [Fluviicola sp. SGL-29]